MLVWRNGSRNWFRINRRKTWEFDSPHQHQFMTWRKEFNWPSFLLGVIIGIIYFCVCIQLHTIVVHWNGSVDENEIGRSFSLRTKSPWGFESPHCYQFMTTQQKRIKHEQDYIEFLERRVKSANYKKNVSPEEYAETEAKLKKARLVMRVLSKWLRGAVQRVAVSHS